MTARTTGRQPRGSRPAGASANPKRPARRPQTQTAGVDGTAALKAVPEAEPTDENTPAQTPGTHEDVHVVDLTSVPPIDPRVLLRAVMTPPGGIESDTLTDALTGAVPTWRLDEEPIYLEVVRDLGVPALTGAEGGTGEVIKGEVVDGEAAGEPVSVEVVEGTVVD